MARLEIERGVKLTVGSNPTPSDVYGAGKPDKHLDF